MKLLLAGEGSDELGDWAKEKPYRPIPPARFERGVLEALLQRVAPATWQVDGGILWKQIRKFKAGQHRGAETRNVLGLMQIAEERGLDGVIFSRDRDRDIDREADIFQGLVDARNKYPSLRLIGGMAIEELEAWILALLGDRGSETIPHAKEHLAAQRGIAGRTQMVDVVDKADLSRVPGDATSLRTWLQGVKGAASALDVT